MRRDTKASPASEHPTTGLGRLPVCFTKPRPAETRPVVGCSEAGLGGGLLIVARISESF